MKTILLIRHAKSSWENFSVSDEERPLNERGKKNAPEMAKRLIKKGIQIDAFLSSPAKRAKTTAEYFTEEYGIKKSKIIIIPQLYMAAHDAFVHVIKNAPEDAKTIAIFSHNNGITDFANVLSSATIDNMPTCSIFAVQADIKSWQEFEPHDNRFYFFDYPKNK